MIGGAIWASLDEPFWFADGKRAGYAWQHGFWGIIDAWRRPKPEWWLSKLIFSPVWFPARSVEFRDGQPEVRVPVENRYAFTDLSELKFNWSLNHHKGRLTPRLGPGARGELEFTLPRGTAEGDDLFLRVTAASGVVVNESVLRLGRDKVAAPPRPASGAPRWSDDGNKLVIEGKGFAAVFDRAKGDFDPADARHRCALRSFPTIHVTRYEFGPFRSPKS